MSVFAIRRDSVSLSLSSAVATLVRRMGALFMRMVVAYGRALHEERMQTLRRLNLQDKQSVLSFGSFI
ncbi:MAG TPA: hypothetical protein VN809_07875 [Telmatospirillum sp.]|nr:hypothetical protein [Telmatospirillum sp.]